MGFHICADGIYESTNRFVATVRLCTQIVLWFVNFSVFLQTNVHILGPAADELSDVHQNWFRFSVTRVWHLFSTQALMPGFAPRPFGDFRWVIITQVMCVEIQNIHIINAIRAKAWWMQWFVLMRSSSSSLHVFCLFPVETKLRCSCFHLRLRLHRLIHLCPN